MPSIFSGNERIQDDDSFSAFISDKISTLNSYCGRSDDNNTMISNTNNSASATRPEEDDIPQLLARARTQRELKRIQMNSLMREEMLQQLLQTDPMDWTRPDVNAATTSSTFA